MAHPSDAAWERAATVQRMGFDEASRSTTDTSRHSVAIATIHGRQDVAAILVMQYELHKQLVAISRGVWALVVLAVLAFLAWKRP